MTSAAVITPGPGAWATHPDRACAQPGIDVDLFFPRRGTHQTVIDKARTICASCPVRTDCADYALGQTNALTGIWGGLTHLERRQARRHTREAA